MKRFGKSPKGVLLYLAQEVCGLGIVNRVVVFFFFQAEDGIRDLTVTGVQTCALPICCGGTRKPGRILDTEELAGRTVRRKRSSNCSMVSKTRRRGLGSTDCEWLLGS